MPWGLLILLLLGLLLFWASVVVYTVRMLSRPPRRTYAWAVSRSLPGDPSEVTLPNGQRGLTFEEWTFRSRAMDLPVWDVRGLDPQGPTIVLTHGWGDSRVVMLGRVGAMAGAASRVIVWDMPGHGDSPRGTRSDLGVREAEDLVALLEHLGTTTGGQERGGPAAEPVMLYGFSLGAGVSIAAAVQAPQRVACVVAEAPYRVPPTPARNVCRLRGLPHRWSLPPAMGILGARFGQGWAWFSQALGAGATSADRFDRAVLASRLPGRLPLVVVHAIGDPVCPIEEGREIARRAPNARVVELDHQGHTDVWNVPAMCERILDEMRSVSMPAPSHRE